MGQKVNAAIKRWRERIRQRQLKGYLRTTEYRDHALDDYRGNSSLGGN